MRQGPVAEALTTTSCERANSQISLERNLSARLPEYRFSRNRADCRPAPPAERRLLRSVFFLQHRGTGISHMAGAVLLFRLERSVGFEGTFVKSGQTVGSIHCLRAHRRGVSGICFAGCRRAARRLQGAFNQATCGLAEFRPNAGEPSPSLQSLMTSLQTSKADPWAKTKTAYYKRYGRDKAALYSCSPPPACFVSATVCLLALTVMIFDFRD